MVYALLLATAIHIAAFFAFQQGFKQDALKKLTPSPTEIQIHLFKEPKVMTISPKSIVSKSPVLPIKKVTPKPKAFSPSRPHQQKLLTPMAQPAPIVYSASKPEITDKASEPAPAAEHVPAAVENANIPVKKALPAEEGVSIPPNFKAAYLNNPTPEYPPLSKRLEEEGKVVLAVHVTAEGRADKVSIHKSSGFSALDEVARKTVLELWRFVPAKRGSEAVAASVFVPIVFKMPEE